MNLMYEDLPESIVVSGEEIPIQTDFRDYVRLIDMLSDTELLPYEKKYLILQYFKKQPKDFEEAIEALTDFVIMGALKECNCKEYAEDGEQEQESQKPVYSFSYDYPYIFSAFLYDYNINIRTIPYMHWWEFRMLFDGLSKDNEIKQRIMYRSIDLSDIKDKDERNRIAKIQREIKLPEDILTDYDIGDAFEW
ncbi:MAG: bacteriophage Gp15 family protein [Lachnospiraceae bacterium]